MDTPERERVEDVIRRAWACGELDGAASVAVRAYGPELVGFLVALAGDEEVGIDAFSCLCEDLWRGLPAFRWDCSFRTWAYALARNALVRVRRDPFRRGNRRLGLSAAPELAACAHTTTLAYRRTENRDAVAELRRRLDPDDQALLILRVDRRMAWSEVARAMADAPLDEGELRRRSAALRKRFERVKESLRRMASERGLV